MPWTETANDPGKKETTQIDEDGKEFLDNQKKAYYGDCDTRKILVKGQRCPRVGRFGIHPDRGTIKRNKLVNLELIFAQKIAKFLFKTVVC